MSRIAQFLHWTTSLRFRVTVALVLLLSASATLMGWVVYRQSQRELLDLHRRTGTLLARTIARTTEIDVKARNSARIVDQLRLLERESLVRYATVFSGDGEVLGLWFREARDVPPSGRRAVALLVGHTGAESVRDLVFQGEPLTEIDVPVTAPSDPVQSTDAVDDPFAEDPFQTGVLATDAAPAAETPRELVGFVRLGLSRQPILARLAEARDRTARLVLVFVVLGGLASVLLVRRFLRPITLLVQATRAIGRGDFDAGLARVPAEGEFAELAAALAQMSSDLRRMRRQLVEANEGLEQKVQERTEELRRALEELRVLDRMKDEFLSSVSHEFRTPLTSIRASAEILFQFEDEPPETRREFLEMILKETDRLTRLVSDILDLVKFESGQLEWHLDEVDLVDLVENALRQLRPLLDEHRLRATIVRREDVPNVRADRERIAQVVSNLLSNAIKFSHEGGSIEVRASVDGDFVKVSVQDEGIGIEPKDQQSIFDRFRQIGDTLTEKPSGTGLGLPICKNIVQRHGGSIWVESRLGKGATFTFTLPVRGPEDVPRDASTRELGATDDDGSRASGSGARGRSAEPESVS